MPRLEEPLVTHVAVTWGDDYPLLAKRVPRGEGLIIGGGGGALGGLDRCMLLDEQGRLWVPRGASLQWARRANASPSTPRANAQSARGAWVALRHGDRVRMCHGALCFHFDVTERDASPWAGPGARAWDTGALLSMLGSLVFHGLFLLLGGLLPPVASALSLDLSGDDLARARYLLTPAAMPPPPPTWIEGSQQGGDETEPAEQPEGKAGTPDASKRSRRRQLPRGPVSKPSAPIEAGHVQDMGILRTLTDFADSTGDSLFDPSAIDPAAKVAMGDLFGEQVGARHGFGGIGMRHAGRGGGGNVQGTRGTGALETRGGPGVGPGVGGAVGVRRGKGDGPPRLRTNVELVGSLSKEAIRRTIRRHANEVRYCYEQGLRKRPDLEGRVRVFFLIQPDGRVGSAVVRSSSVGDGGVEACIAQAVRRWGFPEPRNGGVVQVTYPFLLQTSP